MKKTLLLLAISSFSYGVYAQTTSQPDVAPLNQEFIDYINNPQQYNSTDSEYPLGLVPEPTSPDYTGFDDSHLKNITTLPAIYDMRTNNRITSVKDQAACGSCWLFPVMGSIESRWKILGLGTFDLSEDNLKHCHGFDYGPCDGGNRKMGTAYLSRGKGPVLESDDPYTASSAAGCPTGLNPVGIVTEAWFLPNKNINAIKQAVMDYGAVYNTFFWDKKWYNAAKNLYCLTKDTAVGNNHAVLIVGWNDTITSPLGGKGAWLIKNSWGASWGNNNGFFYMSYNDKKGSTDPTIWVNREAYTNNRVTYGYDHLGWVSNIGGSSTAYGAVKFVATSNQQIKQIATYAVAGNTTISAEIYDSFNGTSFSGLLGTVSAKTFTYSGYYTLNVNTPITIAAGNDFYVKYKVSGTNYSPLAVESKQTGYTSNAVIETGKCWYSKTGSNASWFAMGANTSFKNDLCLKVIAESSTTCPSVSASISNPLINLCSGGTTTITATPSSTVSSYQWQLSTDNGVTWTNIVNSAKYANSSSASLIVKNVTLSFDNYQYRCTVKTECASANSNSTIIRVTSKPVILTQPTSKTTAAGTTATYKVVVANPGNCIYQWQVSTNGTTWTNLSDNSLYTGSTTGILVVNASTALNGRKYRCRLKSSCTSQFVNTTVANLTVTTSTGGKLGNEEEEELTLEATSSNITSLPQVVAYPNPANDNLSINYDIDYSALVEITIYDMIGNRIADINKEVLEQGNHTTDYDVTNLTNGTYLITISAISTEGKKATAFKKIIVAH